MTESRDVLSFAAAMAVLLGAQICVFSQTSDTPDGGPRIETGRVVSDKTSKGSIRGRVVLPGGHFVSQNLKITLLTVNGPQGLAFTDSQGAFEFLDLLPGNYEVQVETSGTEYQVVNQNVQVFRGAPSVITLTLGTGNSTKARSTAPTVSVSELAADIPRPARKEFELASKAARENKSDEAITHLRKAISIYPNFVMARSDLGVQLLAQGKLDEAADELRQAIRIDEKAFNPKLNLESFSLAQHNFAEAQSVLNQALTLNSSFPSALLYCALAETGVGDLDSAEKHLKAAYSLGGTSYSIALFHLGELYMNRGERELALQAFEAYLRDSPAAPNADQVRKLISMLR